MYRLLVVCLMFWTVGCSVLGSGKKPPAEPVIPSITITGKYFSAEGKTENTPSKFNGYNCALKTNEGGGEVIYSFEVATKTVVTARVTEGKGVDVDLHLMLALDPTMCVVRHNNYIKQEVNPGKYFIIVDTFTDSKGSAKAGNFKLEVGLLPITGGKSCKMKPTDVPMFWSPGAVLKTPVTGQVVKEAHIVTDVEKIKPTSAKQGLANHFMLTDKETGFLADRTQTWCPMEGATTWGAGSGKIPPVADEAWYICMYWRVKPAYGTKMLVKNPVNGKAVVVSAGYETGPGSKERVAGVVEEVHNYLGSEHRSNLEIGFLEDQTLPLGPIDCVDTK